MLPAMSCGQVQQVVEGVAAAQAAQANCTQAVSATPIPSFPSPSLHLAPHHHTLSPSYPPASTHPGGSGMQGPLPCLGPAASPACGPQPASTPHTTLAHTSPHSHSHCPPPALTLLHTGAGPVSQLPASATMAAAAPALGPAPGVAHPQHWTPGPEQLPAPPAPSSSQGHPLTLTQPPWQQLLQCLQPQLRQLPAQCLFNLLSSLASQTPSLPPLPPTFLTTLETAVAGQLVTPCIPTSQRLAALEQLRRLGCWPLGPATAQAWLHATEGRLGLLPAPQFAQAVSLVAELRAEPWLPPTGWHGLPAPAQHPTVLAWPRGQLLGQGQWAGAGQGQ
ncbi:hypothetical protein V8C86DRAFT_2533986, partial [Haematococcus lacustris]